MREFNKLFKFKQYNFFKFLFSSFFEKINENIY